MKIIDWIKEAIHRHRRWKIADHRGWACLGHALRARTEDEVRRWVTKANRYYKITRA